MTTSQIAEPKWRSFSHRRRYRRLHTVRRVWFRCAQPQADVPGRIIDLDGTWITDVPSFYLSLGEAINGPNGYFGGCLDAMDDCLCGRFGVAPPLTIRLSHFDQVREALDGRARCRFRAEGFHEAIAAGVGLETLVSWGYLDDETEEDLAKWTALFKAALAGEPFDCSEFPSYFEGILKVFASHDVTFISAE